MDIELKENERLDDLERDNLFVIQNKEKYCFSVDSVLLSDFVKTKNSDDCLELCSGSGVISFLVNAKNHPKSITCLEIDEYMCDIAQRSAKFNNVENIKFFNLDIKNSEKVLKKAKFDVVFSNPPYLLPLTDMSKVSPKFHSTKFETTITLENIFDVVAKFLKGDGSFYMIHSAPRIQEILLKAQKFGLFIKKLQNIYFKENTESPLVMCEFVKRQTPCTTLFPVIL